MYDAIDDPYTYEKSTVLKNRLDLRAQGELDAFEAEISSARAEEPLPEGSLDFAHYKAVHHHLFQDVYGWAGQVRTVRSRKAAVHFAFRKISRIRPPSCSMVCVRPIIYGISMRERSPERQLTSWPN
jgi:fido (protein-threonine AMPylation protein)